MNPKYWEYYNVEGFPKFSNQQQLNDQLFKVAPHFRLESDEVNPLTIRLLIAHEALSNLNSYLRESTESLRADDNATRNLFQQYHGSTTPPAGEVVINPFWTNSGSGIASWRPFLQLDKSRNAPLTSAPSGFVDNGSNWTADLPVEFHPIKVHIAVYSFFTNFASSLDRLAHEIKLLFPPTRNSDEWNWGKLFNEPYKSNLLSRDSGIGAIIDNYHTRLIAKRTTRYRHVISHKGFLQIKVEFNNGSRSWETKLSQDPDNELGPFNVDAPPFMHEELSDLLIFLDEIYERLIAKLSTSLPPW